MSPEAQARAVALADELRQEMNLAEIRRAMELSQEQLAQQLNVGQAAVAKIEKRADMYISTLRRFIEAMGGELELSAKFADHTVQISTLSSAAAAPERYAVVRKPAITKVAASKPKKVKPASTSGRAARSAQYA